MTDPSRDPDTGVGPDRVSPPGIPRWVKVFGIVALVLLVLLILVLTGVFGEGHGPGRHTGGAGGGMLSNGVGGPATASEADRTVEVAAVDAMRFQPSSITVSAGEMVSFVVTNNGQAVHEFTLGDAAMQQEHAEAMGHMPAGMAHDTPNSITMQPGETKQLTWRFGDSATLEYACHQPGHYQAGMRGQITIA